MSVIIVISLMISLLFSITSINSLFSDLTDGSKAYGQTQTYPKSTSAKVTPGSINSTTSFCNPNDALIIGGYSIGALKSPELLSRTFLYKNQPVKEVIPSSATNTSNPAAIPAAGFISPKSSGPVKQVIPSSATNTSNPAATAVSRLVGPKLDLPVNQSVEGWTAGLENNSTQMAIINATALCLSLHH